MVNGDGTAIPSSEFISFPGKIPRFSSKGPLAQTGSPSLFYFPNDAKFCSMSNLTETDPFSLSSVTTDIDPSDFVISDVN